jgi:hypothetical protein
MGELLVDIDTVFESYLLTVQSGNSFGVPAFMFESLAFFFGTIIWQGKKCNVEEDGIQYDSELIINNNPCIIFAIEGN